ncbi:hypothetical protein M9H77_30832 [Catharanthus roseus]|uniref:Uncharacterized protein n=1 Tax=Catharanthus roseus TaxID=4058 RepID=A0ACC0A076_CATRO|nr:hypothetical protein M9H77_30832 [Catharanthus roseus]
MACNGFSLYLVQWACLVQNWLSDGLFAKAYFYPPGFASDHSPCIYNGGRIHSSWELSNSLSGGDLKTLKGPLKELNNKDYTHISSRAEVARKKLKQQQALLQDYPTNQNAKKNFIASLTKRDGSLTTSKEEVQEEFLSFYVGLLGTKQDNHGFHDAVIEDGPRVTPNQANLLVTDYGTLLDKVAKTLLAWPGLNLSYAGKLEVISSVVQGIEAFWLGILQFWLRCWIESQVGANACGANEEDLPHLFFACSFTADVWNNIRRWAGLWKSMTTIISGLKWLMKESRGVVLNMQFEEAML